MHNLQAIKKKPMRDLRPIDWWKIHVNEAMMMIRNHANQARISGYVVNSTSRYLKGMLSGAAFTLGQIIYQDGIGAFEEAEEIRMACFNEAEFLLGPYLEGCKSY